MTNFQVSGIIILYAVINVVLLMAFAFSLLGPVPFGLIVLFGITSVALALAGAIGLLITSLRTRYWPSLLTLETSSIALIIFNVWCFAAASAAV